ncbi:MAG: phosphoribosylamine--glycine ligase [Candidatus Hydrogenedentes bacterium]|nr:phosphoribosylamine--glycine ligase [Candidatus Hydrogenedentota bacterium]
MKVLVVGSGGREHALVWKIAQSPLVDKIYCAPGNPGIARHAECVDIAVADLDKLTSFAQEEAIDLTVVGPEDPLSRGIVDQFNAAGLKVFGPTAAAAELEASKVFAKRFMAKYQLPTATYAEFSDASAAESYVREHGAPIVIKADGLAAGKGVTVAHDVDTAVRSIRAAMVEKVFGVAGTRIVVEEFLEGEEASVLAFADGKTILPMEVSQDHKPVNDGDLGPNTGGMGAYSPAPVVTKPLFDEVVNTVLRPCVDGMAREGRPYTGCLYAGLMITEKGPRVVEFNCRFGDPETQVVLPRMKSDLVPFLIACCDGALDRLKLEWLPAACVSVVIASGGYPGNYPKGKVITGIESAQRDGDVVVFHAGTRRQGEALVTNGGRVLNVTARGSDIPAAIQRAYAAVSKIHFEGNHYRTDIGRRALTHLERRCAAKTP